jgi:hypothetical protein
VSLDPELKSYLERISKGIENIAEEPVLKMEFSPPACPHCKTLNPDVRTHDAGGEGDLQQYVVQAHCTHCNQVFFGLPFSWDCVKTAEEAQNVISERSNMHVGNHSGAN